jgi:two-component system sensor histidine kinase/response regulator
MVRARVLIADDDASARRLLSACLRPLDLQIFEADDGDVACDLFHAHSPALVLTDLGMPRCDGLSVIRQIRASTRPLTPIVMITASHEREARLLAIEAGVTDFVEKPIDPQILLARVRHLLDAQRIREEQQLLLSFIAHDLKQPISAISTNAQWLCEEGVGDPGHREALDDIVTSAQRLRFMVDDFLTIAKLEAAQMTLRPERVVAAEFLKAVERTYRRMAEQRGVRLEIECAESPSLAADHKLLTRLAGNMLENALRHTKSRVLVRVAIEDRSIALSFCNDGPTIAEEDRPKLFEKFSQLDPTRGGSAGLGLYFCKLVVDAHGGALDIGETAEWPTVFRVSLPREHLACV